MESTTSKTEVMKPLFLKAGIPLVLSVAGFVYARIVARRTIIAKTPSLETKVSSLELNDSHEEFRDEERIRSLDSTPSPINDDEGHMITSSNLLSPIESPDVHLMFNVEQEILSLRSRIEEYQRREWDLESKFLRYHVMKEQESVLMDLRNMLLLETAHVELLDREISSMEAETQIYENLAVEYLRVLQQLEFAKHENWLIQRKVKKLSRRTREKSRIIKEKNLKIKATEAEIVTYCKVLETRTNVTKKLEDEVREFQTLVNQLQEEKNELSIKLYSAENSASSISKIEAKGIKMEDYNQLVNEVERLHKDRAPEIAELTYLRWTNACLRHELMKSHEQQQQQQQIEEKENHLVLELGNGETQNWGLDHQKGSSVLVQGEEPCLSVAPGSHRLACPKRKKLLQKLKRWVEGGDNMKSKFDEKEKHEIKCFRRLSVSEEADEEHLIHARRSCSSV